nr:hypothetical protein [Tanacetum cinerariifolium]
MELVIFPLYASATYILHKSSKVTETLTPKVMATTYWRTDPKSGEMIGPLDEEKLAETMWKTICKSRGLPLDAPYVINNDFQNMTR